MTPSLSDLEIGFGEGFLEFRVKVDSDDSSLFCFLSPERAEILFYWHFICKIGQLLVSFVINSVVSIQVLAA